MRGEYLEFTDSTKLREGLPPHTWGIHFNFSAVRFCDGITPTHVGNTLNKHRYIGIMKIENTHFQLVLYSRPKCTTSTLTVYYKLNLKSHKKDLSPKLPVTTMTNNL